MTNCNPMPRLIARGLAVLLWLVGTAYLVAIEYQAPQPDFVLIAATPLVWAAVVTLPVIAGHAFAERRFLAALLLSVSALVGSAYTLTGTLGRQAEARDVRAAEAAAIITKRQAIKRDLDAAKGMLAAAIAKCGQGRSCTDATRATIGVYEGAVAGHQHRLDRLQPTAPDAGERRIALLVAALSGRSEADMRALVANVLPALLGLMLELGSLSCAMYGFAASRSRTDVPASIVRPSDDRPGPTGGVLVAPEPRPDRPSSRKDAVLAGLLTDLGLGRGFPSQRDLCARYGVPSSTLSDWLKEWEASGLIPARRIVGRRKQLAGA